MCCVILSLRQASIHRYVHAFLGDIGREQRICFRVSFSHSAEFAFQITRAGAEALIKKAPSRLTLFFPAAAAQAVDFNFLYDSQEDSIQGCQCPSDFFKKIIADGKINVHVINISK